MLMMMISLTTAVQICTLLHRHIPCYCIPTYRRSAGRYSCSPTSDMSKNQLQHVLYYCCSYVQYTGLRHSDVGRKAKLCARSAAVARRRTVARWGRSSAGPQLGGAAGCSAAQMM